MTKIYQQTDFEKARKQKNKVKAIYFIVFAVFILIAVALYVLYTLQPYKGGLIPLIKWSVYGVTALFVVFSFIYLGIPYKRVKNYYKILSGISVGTHSKTMGKFARYSESLQVRDGIEFKGLFFMEYSEKKQDWFERKVLFDSEKQFPEFQADETVTYYTHGNVLVGYEKNIKKD